MNPDDILSRRFEIKAMMNALKTEDESLKNWLQSLYEKGEIGKKVKSTLGTCTLQTRTTWQYSQEAREDIEKIQNFDRELNHAKAKTTYTWTLRESSDREEQGEG